MENEYMVATRRVNPMKRYSRKRSGSDSVKYFISEKKFLLLGIVAAIAVVIVLFVAPGILVNSGRNDTAAAAKSQKPVVSAAASPSAIPSESAAASDAAASPSAEATASATPKPSASASATAARVLKYTKPNMQGDDVWALQEKLGLKADGFYGQSTADAVREFQKKNG
ncbi:MAG: peptidoglycan-binding domain-containing protein, partial [Eubacteriales bacterium]